MGWLLRDIRTYRLAALLFLVWWLAVWCVTVATWVFDEAGTPLGMHPLGIILTLALPFTAALIVGWWQFVPAPRVATLVASVRGGVIVGALVAVISIIGENLLWLLVYPLILRRPLAEAEGTGGLLWGLSELLEFVVLSAVIGLVLGALGGLVGGLLASAVRLVRRPPANGAN